MKKVFFILIIFQGLLLHAQVYQIGGQQSIVSTCNAVFYDAGGAQGYAGYVHEVTTFMAGSGCLHVTFESFDLGFGGELKIYKGPNTSGVLFGTYSGTNTPPDIVSEFLTFEYIPPDFYIGNLPGWKALLRCDDCSNGAAVLSDPASDCVGAIPLCANSTVIVSTNQYTDTGAESDENGSCISGTGTGGSVWYTFQPQSTGDLDFSIAPSGGTDYDFVLFDATNGCDDLDELSCNYSADFGTTGLTSSYSNYSSSYSGCSGTSYYSAPADCGVWNEPAGVTFGHTYVLFVNFYSGSNAGFTLHFQNDPSTVAITDNIPPTFDATSQLVCNGNSLHVDFSENIDCNTLQASDFTIPGYTVTFANSGCNNGMSYGVDLIFTPPLAPGVYNLHGQTMNDMCGNPLNDDLSLTVASAPVFNVSTVCNTAGTVATLTATGCTGTLTWNEWDTVCTTTCLGVILFGNCVGTWVTNCDSAWATIGTGPSITVNAPFAPQYMASCVGTSGCETQNAFYINCNPSLGVSLNSASICSGGCADITATPSNGTPPYTYTWDPPSLTGPGPHNVCPTDTTDYSVTVTDASGTTASATGTITVSASLMPTISGATSICTGTTTTLDAGAGYTTYEWSTAETTQTITVGTSGTYSVTVSDGSGCSGTTDVTVTVSTNLTPVITGPTTLCSGNPGTLDAGSGYDSYLWSTGDATQTITITTSGTYSVTVSNNSGCSGSASVAVTVGTGLTPVITGPDTVCQGNTAVLDAGSGFDAYSWSTAETTQTISVTASGTYTVTVSDAFGCSGSASATVVVVPFSAMATSTAENCGQSDGTATVIASGGNGQYTYSWNNGQTTQSLSGLASGTYSVTVGDGMCTATAQTFVTGIPGPSAGFSYSPENPVINDGVTLTSNSSGNIVSWVWQFGDGSPTGSGNTVSHTYSNIGTYTVTLIITDMNGCSDTITDTLHVREIYAFYIPNAITPNEDGFNDGFSPRGYNVDPASFEMWVFDRWGKLFYHTTKWYETSAEPWNGTLNNSGTYNDIVMGVYAYRITLKEINGPKHAYMGHVTIIR